MATVNYPELLPHPLVSDGYGFRSNQSQAVSLFDVETQSRDETRTVNVGFTFTDLQYKVFHGWFMNVLIHGQKWFNMRLDGEFYECTFGGVQPQYSLNRKIITVTATLKTRPNTGFVNYTNQRVSYPNAVNYMPSPFDPSGWELNSANVGISTITQGNPSGAPVIGEIEQIVSGTAIFGRSDRPSIIAGETYYGAFIAKQVNYDMDISFFFGNINVTGGFHRIVVNVADGTIKTASAGWIGSVKFTLISDGYSLIQISKTYADNAPDAFLEYRLRDESLGLPPIGSKVFMQAAFFGKTGKYQGAISYNAVNYMPSPFDPSVWVDTDPDGTLNTVSIGNPSGSDVLGIAEYIGPNTYLFWLI